VEEKMNLNKKVKNIVAYMVPVQYSWSGLVTAFNKTARPSHPKLAFNMLDNVIYFLRLLCNKDVVNNKKHTKDNIIKSLKEYIKRASINLQKKAATIVLINTVKRP
jgi:hypothetical protein